MTTQRTAATLVVAVLALTAGACGRTPDGRTQDGSATAPVRKAGRPETLAQRDPQAYRDNVGSAMAEAPESLRGDLRQAIGCTLQQAQAAGAPRALDAGLIRDIVARLKGGSSAAQICQNQNQGVQQ